MDDTAAGASGDGWDSVTDGDTGLDPAYAAEGWSGDPGPAGADDPSGLYDVGHIHCGAHCLQCEDLGIHTSDCLRPAHHETWHLCNGGDDPNAAIHSWPLDGTGRAVCNSYCMACDANGDSGVTCHQDAGHGASHWCAHGHSWS